MKVLFLTSSPGYGHTRAAEAVDVALRNAYPDIQTRYLNITHLIDPQVSAAVQDGYLYMTAEYPRLYQKLYDMDKDVYRQLAGKVPADKELVQLLLRQQHRFFHSADYGQASATGSHKSLDSALLNTLINGLCHYRRMPAGPLLLQGLLGLIYRILAARLKNQVISYDPDLLIATQMYPNALLSRYIQKGAITQPVVGILTDYGAHGVWVRDTTRLYCVSDASVSASLQSQGVPPERIRVTGIPLMPSFESPPSQAEARQRLGLDDRPTILVTGGHCNIGIAETVQHLMTHDAHACRILVTAGKGGTDHAALEGLAARHPQRLTLHPWHSDMASLIRAADLVVGKPGGLSVSEAIACERPFIATCCLGGQEGHNLAFLRRHDIGTLVSSQDLPGYLNGLYSQPGRLAAMQDRAGRTGRRYAAEAVVDSIGALLQPLSSTASKHSLTGGQHHV